MANPPRAVGSRKSYNFVFENCRNVTPSGQNEFTVRTGYAPASSFLNLPDNENVRKYLLEAEGAARRQPSQVHRAIRETLDENGDQFSVLNGGIVIVATKVSVDEKTRTIKLTGTEQNPVSIINGSQTRGEIKAYLEKSGWDGKTSFGPAVRYEVIESENGELINEVSIARNFQNQVAYLSILGKREILEDLEQAIQKTHPGMELMKSETDSKNSDLIPTEKLLQVCFALLPDELFKPYGSKTVTYSSKAKWLKAFEKLVNKSLEIKKQTKTEEAYWELLNEKRIHDPDLERFVCILEICGSAWSEYRRWKSHKEYSKGFHGKRENGQATVSRKNGSIDLLDGVVFPVIAALSAFVEKKNGIWTLAIPASFKQGQFFEKQLIDAAKETYKDSAKFNPQSMGKTLACYNTIGRVTKMYEMYKEELDRVH